MAPCNYCEWKAIKKLHPDAITVLSHSFDPEFYGWSTVIELDTEGPDEYKGRPAKFLASFYYLPESCVCEWL